MKRLLALAALAAVLPGCVVVVDDGKRRPVNRQAEPLPPSPAPAPQPPPPPPPPEPAVVEVSWKDARLVLLREYYGCDWDLVGTFEHYESRYAIEEEDLFSILFISQLSRMNFHEVVFHFERSNRDLIVTARACRLTGTEVFVDIAGGADLPWIFEAPYRSYGRRDPSIVLTNAEFNALLWLRVSVQYCGWSVADAFSRWESASLRNLRPWEILREEPQRFGQGRRTCTGGVVVEVERPWIRADVRLTLDRHCEESRRRAEADIEVRIRGNQLVAPTPRADEAHRRQEESRRRQEEHRRRAAEEAARRRVSREATWVECRSVVIREYFGCSWDVVGAVEYYESRYGIDDEDLLVLLRIALHARVTIHDVVAAWVRLGRSHLACAREFRMSGWEFFVDLPSGTRCPGEFSAAYAAYWRRDGRYVITNLEFRSLCWLSISVSYCGWTPADTFQRWERHGAAGFREAVRVEADRCGQGGKNWEGRAPVRVERPWAKAEVRARDERERTEAVRRSDDEIRERARAGRPVAPAPGEEEARRRQEEQRRRAAADEEAARRRAMEAEVERHNKEAAERARQAEEERRRREALSGKQREEDERRRRMAEEERRKVDEENRRRENEKRAEDDRRKAEEEKRRKAEDEQRRADEEKRRRENEKKAEDDRRKAEEEKRRKAEDDKRRADDAKKKAEDDRRKADEEKRRKADDDKRRAEEEKKKAEDERRKRDRDNKDKGKDDKSKDDKSKDPGKDDKSKDDKSKDPGKDDKSKDDKSKDEKSKDGDDKGKDDKSDDKSKDQGEDKGKDKEDDKGKGKGRGR